MYKPLSLKRLFKIEKVAKNNFVDFSAKGQHPDKRFVHPNFNHASEGDRKNKQGDQKNTGKGGFLFLAIDPLLQGLDILSFPFLLDIFQDVWDCSGDNHERSKPGERKIQI